MARSAGEQNVSRQLLLSPPGKGDSAVRAGGWCLEGGGLWCVLQAQPGKGRRGRRRRGGNPHLGAICGTQATSWKARRGSARPRWGRRRKWRVAWLPLSPKLGPAGKGSGCGEQLARARVPPPPLIYPSTRRRCCRCSPLLPPRSATWSLPHPASFHPWPPTAAWLVEGCGHTRHLLTAEPSTTALTPSPAAASWCALCDQPPPLPWPVSSIRQFVPPSPCRRSPLSPYPVSPPWTTATIQAILRRQATRTPPAAGSPVL